MVAMDTVTQYAVQYGMQAVVALGIFAAGALASRWAGNVIRRRQSSRTSSQVIRTS